MMAAGQIVLDRRIERLERIGRQQRGAAQQWDGYQFKVSPTCPPSTSVHFRGGMCWLPSSVGVGQGWFVNNYTVDLADTDMVTVNTSVDDVTYTFTNAYYYVGCVMVLNYGLNPEGVGLKPDPLPDQSITLAGSDGSVAMGLVEYATAAEAENAIAAMSMERANSAGLPMAALILRNDGNIVDPNRWMEIDRVNRGRSYLLWDCRQAWEIG